MAGPQGLAIRIWFPATDLRFYSCGPLPDEYSGPDVKGYEHACTL